jgi:hypothetical protein
MERSEQYFSYTLAKTLGLFIKRCAAKGLITNQKSKEKTRYQRHKHATHGAPYALRCERVGQADDDDTNKEFVMRQTYVRSDRVFDPQKTFEGTRSSATVWTYEFQQRLRPHDEILLITCSKVSIKEPRFTFFEHGAPYFLSNDCEVLNSIQLQNNTTLRALDRESETINLYKKEMNHLGSRSSTVGKGQLNELIEKQRSSRHTK